MLQAKYQYFLISMLTIATIASTRCLAPLNKLNEVDEQAREIRDSLNRGMTRSEVHQHIDEDLLEYVCDWSRFSTAAEYQRVNEFYVIGDLEGYFVTIILEYIITDDDVILEDFSTEQGQGWLPREDSGCTSMLVEQQPPG